MLRSDEFVGSSLARVSAMVKARGLGPRVVERVLKSNPHVVSGTLGVLSGGVCGGAPVTFLDLDAALASPDQATVWRAGMMACWAEFVTTSLGKSPVPPGPMVATSWAIAETAFWAAGHHIVEPDEAFLCGLTMDAGLVAMVYSVPEVYGALAACQSPRPVHEFEGSSFGFDHAAVGAAVLRQNKLTEETAKAALGHHDPLLSLDMTGKVLRVAQVAVAEAGGSFGFPEPAVEVDRAVLEGALLREEHRSELAETAKRALDRGLRFTTAGFIAA